MLHRAYLASLEWKLPDLVDALLELSAIDRDVKNGSASGPELLTGFLLSRVPPPSRAAAR